MKKKNYVLYVIIIVVALSYIVKFIYGPKNVEIVTKTKDYEYKNVNCCVIKENQEQRNIYCIDNIKQHYYIDNDTKHVGTYIEINNKFYDICNNYNKQLKNNNYYNIKKVNLGIINNVYKFNKVVNNNYISVYFIVDKQGVPKVINQITNAIDVNYENQIITISTYGDVANTNVIIWEKDKYKYVNLCDLFKCECVNYNKEKNVFEVYRKASNGNKIYKYNYKFTMNKFIIIKN